MATTKYLSARTTCSIRTSRPCGRGYDLVSSRAGLLSYCGRYIPSIHKRQLQRRGTCQLSVRVPHVHGRTVPRLRFLVMRGFQSPKYSPLDYPIPAETNGRQAHTGGGANFGLSDHKPSPTLRRELSANPPPFRPVRP